jgi:hypothetical protein
MKLNEKGAGISELIFIVVMLSALILPFAFFKLWWWLAMMVTIGVVFGIFEATSYFKTGHTLSQKFWAWSIAKDENGKYTNRGKALALLGTLFTGWVMLLIHLAWKLIATF